ncbi:MAG: serine/threonine-protein kinase [bacterium]|nr:serine/threonine-protein kinase [bacterium]
MKICSVCERCFEEGVGFCSDPAHGELADGPYSVDIVPGYRIERVLASSPRAVTYQAQQTEYGQNCAISIAEPDAAEFLADARIAAGLFQSCVAGVVESGELSNGSAYAVFQESGNRSLRDVFQGGTLSLLDEIRIARQAAEAVSAIHTAGLLHGALRPENVSITGLGSEELAVRIHNIDLGSAFANGILSNRFSMDSSLNSLLYFAPERFRGEAPTVQSDVYSLGVLLYELLSGHPPFEAQSAAALAEMHLNQKPPEIKIENFDLRMLLTHTMNESLQKQSSFRQSTADLFARQMRHIEQLATHVSTPPPAVAVAMAASAAQLLPRKLEPATVARASESLRPFASVPDLTHLEAAPIASAPVVEPTDTPAMHPVQMETPMPFIPTQERSRLKGMKNRARSYVSESKAVVTPTPTPIDWQQPEDDVPSVDAVREELASCGVIAPFEAVEQSTHAGTPVERYEVKWGEPMAVEASRLAAEFAPISGRSAIAEEPAVLEYRTHGPDLGKLPIYGVALLAFVVVGFGVFRLGSALADDTGGYIGESRPSKLEMPAPPVRTAAIEPQIAVVSIPEQQISVPAPDETFHEQSSILRERTVPTSTSKPSKRSGSVEPKTGTEATRQSPRGEAPIVPSTLVITRGPGKPKAIVVTESPARESRPTKVGSGATRPRIVSLPN